ncbi:hypothetical protein BGX27_003582 [Mortierella sp. AM989]|nr:hypothetical protein BGX27_003582 [Mortierella sp. AM989]
MIIRAQYLLHLTLQLLATATLYLYPSHDENLQIAQTLDSQPLTVHAHENNLFSYTLTQKTLDINSFSIGSASSLTIELYPPLLPWLSFNSTTKTLSGTPPKPSIGSQSAYLRIYSLSHSVVLELVMVVVATADVDHFSSTLDMNITHQQLSQSKRLQPRALNMPSSNTLVMNSIMAVPYGFSADAVVWEGQSSPMRVQLDPEIFFITPSTTGDIKASAGPVTYYAKLDTSTSLPSWLKFDSSALEFSGVPPIGTYRQTTILTVVIEASTVPGFIQATNRFTVEVMVHSLALTTFSSRPCSSSALFASPSEDSLWQEYLPDLNLDPIQRTVKFEFGMDLFRIDGCIQPSSIQSASSLDAINSSDPNQKSVEKLATTRWQNPMQTPVLTQLSVQLSAESSLELSRPNNTLPEWLTFDSTRRILAGVVPPTSPARLLLDVLVVDSFKTSSTFKLQIFSQPIAPLSFKQSIPDIWVKSGESFKVNLQLGEYLNSSNEAGLYPVQSRFIFEVINPADNSSNARNISTLSTIRITSRYSGTNDKEPNSAGGSSCTYNDLWRQESQESGGKNLIAIFPSWFGYNSSTTTSQHPLTGGVVLSGLIPCEVTLRARWIVRGTQSQWTSIEFIIRTTMSGPPFGSTKSQDPSLDAQHHGSLAPIGIKIAVAFAIALPVILALWFLVRRYCQKLKGDQVQPNIPLKGRDRDLEHGWPPSRGSRGDLDHHSVEAGLSRHRQPTSELVSHREPEYRSSYEDDPSVGHRDSYSEKYVAEHQPWTCSSENEGEGSGSDRLSILGWLFGERLSISTPAIEEPLTSSNGQSPRQLNEDEAMFSLKRISMGYPFESSRFGFINGSRISHYDCSPAELDHAIEDDTNAECIQVTGNDKDRNCQQIPGARVALGGNVSEHSKMTFKRESILSKRGGRRDNKRRNRSNGKGKLLDANGKVIITGSSRCLAEVELRVCHSVGSTGTGYMASMSEYNTSIDERQESARNSEDDQECKSQNSTREVVDLEEMAKARRRLSRSRLQADIKDSDLSERFSWTSVLDLDATRKTANIEDIFHELKKRDVKHVVAADLDGSGVQIPRSDSGALMTGSISANLSNSRVSTTYEMSKETAAPLRQSQTSSTPLSQDRADPRASDTESSLSSSSARTVPVTASETTVVIGQQFSLRAAPGSIQRLSIVELLQSNDAPVSPLSAFSASLPSWNNAVDMAREKYRDDVCIIQPENFTIDRSQLQENHIPDGEGSEKTKWMVVPCNQPVRNFPVRNVDGNSTKERLLDFRQDEQPVIVGTVGLLGDAVEQYTGKDERYFSIQSELGIIEQAIGESFNESGKDTALHHVMRKAEAAAVSPSPVVRESPDSPPSALYQQCTLQHDMTSILHNNPTIARQSNEHIRPISHPNTEATAAFDMTVPRKLVKATIGMAFHYTSSICGPNSGSLSTSNLLQYPQVSPFDVSFRSFTSSSLLQPMTSPVEQGTEQVIEEYRAFLVSGPQDQAQAQTRLHRASSSLSSMGFEQRDLGCLSEPQSKRKLPDWIQFNSKLCSIWGRPVLGTAGEWIIKLVRSCPAPAVENKLPTVASQPPWQNPSAVPRNKQERQMEPGIDLEQDQEFAVELVVLTVKEPGDAPLPPILPSGRSWVYPTLGFVQS